MGTSVSPSAEETADCNMDECVVNCLGDWSEFSECTQKCGGWVLNTSSPKLSRFVPESTETTGNDPSNALKFNSVSGLVSKVTHLTPFDPTRTVHFENPADRLAGGSTGWPSLSKQTFDFE